MKALTQQLSFSQEATAHSPSPMQDGKGNTNSENVHSAFSKMLSSMQDEQQTAKNGSEKKNLHGEKTASKQQGEKQSLKHGHKPRNSQLQHLQGIANQRGSKAHNQSKMNRQRLQGFAKNTLGHPLEYALNRGRADKIKTGKRIQLDVAMDDLVQNLLRRLLAQSSQEINKAAAGTNSETNSKKTVATKRLGHSASGLARSRQNSSRQGRAESTQATAKQASQAEPKSSGEQMAQAKSQARVQGHLHHSRIKMDAHFNATAMSLDRPNELAAIKTDAHIGSELGNTILKHMQAQGWLNEAALRQGPMRFEINDKLLGKISVSLQQAGNITRVGLLAEPFSAAQLQVASDWLRKRLKGQNEVLVASRPKSTAKTKREAQSWR